MFTRINNYFKSEEHRLVLRIDVFMLAWAFIAGLTKDMDQSSTTQAYVSGWKESLKLNENELVEFTTFFSIGYAIGIVPAQMIQTRIRPSLFLPACEIVWGFMTLATFACKSSGSVYVVRFFLGIFESTSWPGLVLLILNWYTEKELAKRLAIFGVSGMFGNLLLGVLQAALYQNMNGSLGLAAWQWLFIINGCVTITWGMIGFFVIPDSPVNSRALWLTRSQKNAAQKRMTNQGTAMQKLVSGATLRKKLSPMIKSPLTYLFLASFVQWAWSQRVNSYFLLYLKGLKNTQGSQLYSTHKVNLIPLGGYAISIVCNIGLNAISDSKRWRWQIAIFAAAIQAIACAVLSSWPDSNNVIIGFYFLTFSTAAWGYALIAWLAEILRKEPEARGVLVAIGVTLIYVGHATIPLRAWRVKDSPQYPIGFPLATAFAAFGIVTTIVMHLWVKRNPALEMHGYDDPMAQPGNEHSDHIGCELVKGSETVNLSTEGR